MKPILHSPMMYGKYVTVTMLNGREYRRVVRYSRADGLYVVIANRKILERDVELRKEDNDVKLGKSRE